MSKKKSRTRTVKVPAEVSDLFENAEKVVDKYFRNLKMDPTKASIEVNGQRYLLVRASALSLEFLESIQRFYSDRGKEEAMLIGKNMLFDLAHLIGLSDAKNFHQQMKLKDPIAKLSAGPVHFAYTGWASVHILEESRPSPDKNYFLKYHHPYSFEADSWIRSGKKSDQPVCFMNAGYSSGWCEASFGISLTAVEIACKAKGDPHCTFIMAPPDQIEKYVKSEKQLSKKAKPKVPYFLERKKMEEQVKQSLVEKEMLLREIHHRVKNNLQVITSLLGLQSSLISDEHVKELFTQSQYRINSMAFVHEMLYQADDISRISFGDYLKKLVGGLVRSMKGEKNKVKLSISVPDINLSIDTAVPLGLMINEIITNSLKYGITDDHAGTITIKLIVEKGKKFRLTIGDNGAGYSEEKISSSSSLGLLLIRNLARQLEGTIEKEKRKGTHYTINFREIGHLK
ncbi:MAG: XylR N-terminal domain-containing protein [Bacteroidetes bacterium]|nr:XylR N-terminal domain-containing protein [Bacteroidota bacterium]